MWDRRTNTILLASVVGLATSVILGLGLWRRRVQRDPLAEANFLISRCRDKIAQIEASLADLQAVMEAGTPG